MVEMPSLVDMLKSGAHFGHKKSKRHPKMAPFIFTTKDAISIIDLEKTVEYLKTALEFVEGVARAGGTVLFVGVKNQGKEIIKEKALACGMPYVNSRWLGGTLTNFVIIGKMIKKYKKLKDSIEKGEFAKYTKKEQLDISREVDELEGLIGGISTLTKLPEAIFILDLKKDKTAFAEAMRKKVQIVALCDTNVNPENVQYPIPANDDAVKSITLFVSLLTDAVNQGKEKRVVDLEKQFAQQAVDKEKQAAAIIAEKKIQADKAAAAEKVAIEKAANAKKESEAKAEKPVKETPKE
ncbi:MAG: 30S ribosomal protein S2 [bacterium]|nr:30S ribosomal protein S2 [bacterium]